MPVEYEMFAVFINNVRSTELSTKGRLTLHMCMLWAHNDNETLIRNVLQTKQGFLSLQSYSNISKSFFFRSFSIVLGQILSGSE